MGKPFELAGGTSRDFRLVLHAQDVVRADHTFNVTIEADDGSRDE